MGDLEMIRSQPKAFSLPKGKTALVMIDMQRDFVKEGGYGYLQCNSETVFNEVAQIIEPCVQVLNAARKLGMTVLHTREGHETDLRDLAPSKRIRQYLARPENYNLLIGDKGPMGRLLVRGEYGHDIIDELKPWPTEVVIDKPGKGTFYNTDVHQILVSRGITHLLICGVTTECCVGTTFREANDHGFECCVLTDCTNGFNQDIVRETINTFYAYDGLLGYIGSGTELVTLASSNPNGLKEITNDSFLSKVESEIIYPTTFCIDSSIGRDSHIVKSVVSKGGQLVDKSGSFELVVNDSYFKSSYPVFTPSSGMVSLHGTVHTMFGSIGIIAKTISEARYVFANERGFDPKDELSKLYHEYPMKPVDFRGAGQHFRFAAQTETLKSRFSKSGQLVLFDWDLFASVIDHKDLLDAELYAIGKSGPTVTKSRYIQLAAKKRQILNLFQPACGPHLVICSNEPSVHYIVRLLGFPSLVVDDIILIAEYGLDGVLLDIATALF